MSQNIDTRTGQHKMCYEINVTSPALHGLRRSTEQQPLVPEHPERTPRVFRPDLPVVVETLDEFVAALGINVVADTIHKLTPKANT